MMSESQKTNKTLGGVRQTGLDPPLAPLSCREQTTWRMGQAFPWDPLQGRDYMQDGQAFPWHPSRGRLHRGRTSLLLTPSRGSQGTGRYKTWTLDSGLDYGLDYGLNFGLDFGLDSRTYKLTSHFKAFPWSSTQLLLVSCWIVQTPMHFFSIDVSV